MTKILSVIPTLGPGGAETLASEISIGFRKHGLDSALFAIAGIRGVRGNLLENRLRENGVNINIGHGSGFKNVVKNIISIYIFIKSYRPTHVICHLQTSELYIFVIYAILFNILNKTIFVRVIHSPIIKNHQKWTALLFRKTVAVSRQTLELAAVKLGEAEVLYIPNGCHIDELQTNFSLHNLQEENSESAVRLFCVGSLRDGMPGVKGLDLSLRALDGLTSLFPVELHIAGTSAEDEKTLEEFRKHNQLTGNVIYHGQQSSIPECLNRVKPHLCLMPSRSEGESLVLMEYSILGIPVVLSEIRSFKDMYEANFDWTFHQNNNAISMIDAICRRIKDPSSFPDYKMRARYAFSINNVIKKYLNILSLNN